MCKPVEAAEPQLLIPRANRGKKILVKKADGAAKTTD